MADRPDLVLFLTDQQRHDQTGWMSGGHFHTPNMDALAARGTVFENAYSASTTCVPARAALLTGVGPHRLPTHENGLALEAGFWTLARELRDAGYETAAIGKMHFSPVHADHGFETLRLCEHLTPQGYRSASEDAPDDHLDEYHHWLLDQGLGDWRFDDPGALSRFPHAPEVHPTGWVERETREFLAARDTDRPLFLVVSFPHPHAPYNPADPYRSMYQPADSHLPDSTFEANTGLPKVMQDVLTRFMGGPVPRVDPGTREPLPRFIAKVRAMLHHIDEAIGNVLADLDLDHTVVFLTSDHGDFSGHRGLLRKNPWLPFDDLAKVPFVVAGPDIAARRSAALVQTSDLVLTCLDYAGIAPPPLEFDTCSLLGLVSEAGNGGATGTDDDRQVFCAMNMGWPMIRRGRFKFIMHVGWRAGALFDLEADPGETVDLSGEAEHHDLVAEFTAILDAELAKPLCEWPP